MPGRPSGGAGGLLRAIGRLARAWWLADRIRVAPSRRASEPIRRDVAQLLAEASRAAVPVADADRRCSPVVDAARTVDPLAAPERESGADRQDVPVP